jgi:hypothetical protein
MLLLSTCYFAVSHFVDSHSAPLAFIACYLLVVLSSWLRFLHVRTLLTTTTCTCSTMPGTGA